MGDSSTVGRVRIAREEQRYLLRRIAEDLDGIVKFYVEARIL